MIKVSRFTAPDSEWEFLRTFDSSKAAAKFVKREESHHPELYGHHLSIPQRHYLLIEAA